MADREQTKKDFKSWRGEFFKPETRGAYALEDLTSHFKSKLDKEDLEELIQKVKWVCFVADNIHQGKIADLGLSIREGIRNLESEIPQQIDSIQKLIKFMEENPDIALLIAFEKGFGDSYPSFKEKLISFQEGLKEHFKQFFSEKNIDGSFPLMAWKISGPLIFPDSISKQFEKKDPEVNGLLFLLTFIFRTYTASNWKDLKKSNPDLLVKRPNHGKMPNYGEPCYRLVESFANAIFFPKGREEDENKEYSEQKIKLRISELIKKEACLKPWWFILMP